MVDTLLAIGLGALASSLILLAVISVRRQGETQRQLKQLHVQMGLMQLKEADRQREKKEPLEPPEGARRRGNLWIVPLGALLLGLGRWLRQAFSVHRVVATTAATTTAATVTVASLYLGGVVTDGPSAAEPPPPAPTDTFTAAPPPVSRSTSEPPSPPMTPSPSPSLSPTASPSASASPSALMMAVPASSSHGAPGDLSAAPPVPGKARRRRTPQRGGRSSAKPRAPKPSPTHGHAKTESRATTKRGETEPRTACVHVGVGRLLSAGVCLP